MKKVNVFLITVVLLFVCLFTSCDDTAEFKGFTPKQSFSISMSAQKEEKSFSADITCLGYNDIEIAFTSPEELSGFSIATTDEGFSVNAFGIPDEITSEEINKSSLLNILVETLRAAVFTNHGKFVKSDDIYNADLTIGNTPVSVVFSKDGVISKMECQSIDFSAVFEYSG